MARLGEPAATAVDQLKDWDAGESIWSIEMGGLGPGYEQSIQVLAIEIVRDYLKRPLPTKTTWQGFGDDTVQRIDRKMSDGRYSCGGFSGAQVGAAKNLAFAWLKQGPAKMLASAPRSRHIQVSNFWPQAAK